MIITIRNTFAPSVIAYQADVKDNHATVLRDEKLPYPMDMVDISYMDYEDLMGFLEDLNVPKNQVGAAEFRKNHPGLSYLPHVRSVEGWVVDVS